MEKQLPARPNLDRLRRQAKTLLAQLKGRATPAAQAFIDHLPEARQLTTAAVCAAGFRLADAQSVVAAADRLCELAGAVASRAAAA